LESCEIDDGDGVLDTNRGVDGEIMRKRDRGVSNGSCGVLICEVIVAVRGHIGEGVLVEVLRMSRKWGVRRLSGGSSPYMCCCIGVGSFKLLHLIVSKYVILIDLHVLRVRISFPFDQIL
jgi:hypothetical protein